MRKRTLFILLGLLLVLVFGTDYYSKQQTDDGKVHVGILQLMDQSALDQARKGFIAELKKEGYSQDKNLVIDYVNAQGDQANLRAMSERLINHHNDLNLAIATPAAQALLAVDQKTPLLFTAITDPVDAGLVKSFAHPDKNVTGVTDSVPVSEQIALLQKMFPQAKTVGLLYNAAEPNSVIQIKEAQKVLQSAGLKVVARTVATTNDVEQAATSLARQVDVMYLPADNVLTAAMALMGKVSEKTKTPVIPATTPMVQLGGVATQGINYYQLGQQTAQMAVKILKGKQISQLPVEKPAKSFLSFNKKLAAVFKIDPAKFGK
ncbi:ABC transporter substrate binding protein [Lapidilactobacillus salsurivasis]